MTRKWKLFLNTKFLKYWQANLFISFFQRADGEVRCYSVDPSMNDTRPCDTVDCHHGVCVEKEEITQCKCKIGFMGDNCNQGISGGHCYEQKSHFKLTGRFRYTIDRSRRRCFWARLPFLSFILCIIWAN